MKKYLLVVVGIIIGVIGTSYAAYKLKAEQVSFDKNNTGLNSDNIQSAIDELATGILTYGDAEANDILEGKTALIQGEKIIGTLKSSNGNLTLLSTIDAAGKKTTSYTFSSDYDRVIAFVDHSYMTQSAYAIGTANVFAYSLKVGSATTIANAGSGGVDCSYWGVCAVSGIKVVLLQNVKNGDSVSLSAYDVTSTSLLALFSLE